MRFFEDCRPSFYFHGGRLVKDNKSGKHYWRLTLVLTLDAQEVASSCDELISDNYVAIETVDAQVEEIKIAGEIFGRLVAFFALKDTPEPVLQLGPCNLDQLRMTRVEKMTELWLQLEAENSKALHSFVREHIFTRLWVEFTAAQLGMMRETPMQHLQTLANMDGATVTMEFDGKEVVLAKPRAKRKDKQDADGNRVQ